jgi:hypothetical protein
MLVNINAASASRQGALGELGELSRARVILGEFKYNRSVRTPLFVPLCGTYRIDDCGRNAIDPE